MIDPEVTKSELAAERQESARPLETRPMPDPRVAKPVEGESEQPRGRPAGTDGDMEYR